MRDGGWDGNQRGRWELRGGGSSKGGSERRERRKDGGWDGSQRGRWELRGGGSSKGGSERRERRKDGGEGRESERERNKELI